jgi:uncharacterized protein (TIGR02246 family)
VDADEQAIRDLVAEWLRATTAGDLARLLHLMAEDVIFLAPGQPPLRGKEAFASAFRSALGHVRITAISEIQEVRVSGDMGYCWNHFVVTLSPLESGPVRRSKGYTLTILRKTQHGRWLVTRDANLLARDL